MNNPLLIVAVVGTQLLQLAVLAVLPLRDLLLIAALTPTDSIRLALAAVLLLGVMEIYKRAQGGSPDFSSMSGIAFD